MALKKVDPNKVLTIIVGGDMDKDDDRLFNDPNEWKTHPRHTVYVHSYEELHNMLSPAKLDLLIELMNYNPWKEENVGSIAQKTKRKREAISRDLHHLAAMNLIKLKKAGKMVLVTTPFESIQIQFAQKT